MFFHILSSLYEILMISGSSSCYSDCLAKQPRALKINHGLHGVYVVLFMGAIICSAVFCNMCGMMYYIPDRHSQWTHPVSSDISEEPDGVHIVAWPDGLYPHRERRTGKGRCLEAIQPAECCQ